MSSKYRLSLLNGTLIVLTSDKSQIYPRRTVSDAVIYFIGRSRLFKPHMPVSQFAYRLGTPSNARDCGSHCGLSIIVDNAAVRRSIGRKSKPLKYTVHIRSHHDTMHIPFARIYWRHINMERVTTVGRSKCVRDLYACAFRQNDNSAMPVHLYCNAKSNAFIIIASYR